LWRGANTLDEFNAVLGSARVRYYEIKRILEQGLKRRITVFRDRDRKSSLFKRCAREAQMRAVTDNQDSLRLFHWDEKRCFV
jgi:hypothetical protein